MTDGDEPVGTLRWWGESWGAPANDPRNRVDVPTGSRCDRCGELIEQTAQGISIPVGFDEQRAHFTLSCWLRSVGVELT